MMNILLWLYLILTVLVCAGVFCYGCDFFIGACFRQAPEIPSSGRLRAAIVNEIKSHYKNAKTVIDIGACYGGMARNVALNFPKMQVHGIEKMPVPYLISRILKFFRGPKNMRLHFGDGMKFLKKSEKFDIGVAWLLTCMMGKVETVSDRVGVLLVLDFPLPNRKPTRVVNLHTVMIRRREYQHKLYIYEN